MPGLIVSEAASKILEKSEGVGVFIAPSDLWSRQKDSGKSIAELFADNGIYLTRINTGRVEGWLCLKEWLCPYMDSDGNKNARLKIFCTCRDIIRCIPLLLHDRKNCGDASTEPHSVTHAPDALRYFAVSRPALPNVRKEERSVKLSKKLISSGFRKILQ